MRSSRYVFTSVPMPMVNTRVPCDACDAIAARCSGCMSPTLGTPSVRNTSTSRLPSCGLPFRSRRSASRNAPSMLVPPSATSAVAQLRALSSAGASALEKPSRKVRTPDENEISRKRSRDESVPSICSTAALACSSFGPLIEPETSTTIVRSRPMRCASLISGGVTYSMK